MGSGHVRVVAKVQGDRSVFWNENVRGRSSLACMLSTNSHSRQIGGLGTFTAILHGTYVSSSAACAQKTDFDSFASARSPTTDASD